MRRTSTLQAAGAALGLLAGFMMAPQGPAPLDRDVTPYAVTVAWRTSGPPEVPSVSGVEVDDWGGRIAPTPPPAERTAPRRRTRTPEAKARTAPRTTALAKPAPRRQVVRGADLAAATFGMRKRDCPREQAAAREAQRAREEAHRTREVHEVKAREARRFREAHQAQAREAHRMREAARIRHQARARHHADDARHVQQG
jgi:hypothetical protein